MNQPPEDLDGWPTAEDLERELARWSADGEAELEALADLSEADLLAALVNATPRPRRRRRAR